MNFEDNQKNNKFDNSILKQYPIKIMEEKGVITLEEIEQAAENDEQQIVVCDFYPKDIEKQAGVEVANWGLGYKNIINIDHHAPIESMERFVSSTNLAIEFVKANGSRSEAMTIINHTDCDSVLSSAIMKGVIPPEQKFGDAAIAADHTGEVNEIADLLQSLEDKRDYDFSLMCLELCLEGKDLPEEANELIEKYNRERLEAKIIVESGRFKKLGLVSYALLEEKIKGSFFPSLLPDSTIIITASPLKSQPNKLEVKIRLGQKTLPNLTLHKLGLENTPINFGGRWNAGSNKRHGGTDLKVEECAQIVNVKLTDFIEQLS